MVSGGTVTRYRYDLRGRQTETHRDGDNIPEATTARDSRGGVVGERANGVTTTHLLDYHNLTGYSQVLEQRTGTGAGTLTRSFVVGPTVLAQADGQGGGGTAYLGRDAHSGVRFTTDAAGLMTEQYAYDAFGVPQGFDPATARSAHQFHGERFSPALGGSDVRGERVYESEKGRWRTADRYTPGVGDLSDRNRYAFVGADPVNHTDPTGMAVAASGFLGFSSLMGGTGLGLKLAAARYTTVAVGALLGISLIHSVASNLSVQGAITDYLASGEQALISAGTLLAANVSVVVSAMNTALRAAARTGRQVQNNIKMFPVIRSREPHIFNNVTRALAANPAWFVLTYNGPNSLRTIANRTAALGGYRGRPPALGESLDEYPFASTLQGGQGAFVTPVPLIENWIQGGMLSAFYRWSLNSTPGNFIVVPVPL